MASVNKEKKIGPFFFFSFFVLSRVSISGVLIEYKRDCIIVQMKISELHASVKMEFAFKEQPVREITI